MDTSGGHPNDPAIFAYKRRLATLEEYLHAELNAVWERVKTKDLDTIRDTFVEVIPALIDKYGQGAAFYAGQWYEHLTKLSAVVPDLYAPEAWASSTRWALSPLWKNGDENTAFANLVSTTTRHVRNHGRFTIDESVRADPRVMYARVLQGEKDCNFCLVLASRGPVYGDSTLATRRKSDGKEYHDNCNCIAVPMVGRWVVDESVARNFRWEGQRFAGHNFEQLYDEVYKPHWQEGDSMRDVVRRMETGELGKRDS